MLKGILFIYCRQLYWCDWEFESIFTSAYDGSGFVSIVSSPGSWIYGIALDVISEASTNQKQIHIFI